MKHLSKIAGGLLGLLFIAFSLMFFLGQMPAQVIPKDTPPWHFMAAFGPTGYLCFVKIVELVGGVLTAIPKTRNFGLLCLGPVIVNILAFHVFVKNGSLLDPMLITICLLSGFLLWSDRAKFLALRN